MTPVSGSSPGWAVGAASVRGRGHERQNLPCQDSAAVRVAADRLVAVVCDGAGESAKSEIGAQIASSVIADHLIAKPLATTADANAQRALREEVIRAVWAARRAIVAARECGDRRHDYHTTLVGMVADEQGGAFFHIGDGLGLASCPARQAHDDGTMEINYWACTGISWPENGEYANETFFLTQPMWQDHLRIKPLAQSPELVVLLSDGLEDLVVQNGRPNNPFIDVVVHECADMGSDGQRDLYLGHVLSSPKADPITSDDKTLIVARRITGDTQASGEPSPVAGECSLSLLAPDEVDGTETEAEGGAPLPDRAPLKDQSATLKSKLTKGIGRIFRARRSG